MNAMTPIEPATGLALLRAPFPPNQISKLPKPYKKDSPKGKCDECGGYHGLPAVHLDYVGHAALTDRLLDADPMWSWEPVAFGADGLPALDRAGGMWIKLTVCGVTRLGYGNADGKNGGDAVKELIGDALRNAAMRFGAALDLWHKGDLHADDEPDGAPAERRQADRPAPRQESAPRHDPAPGAEPLISDEQRHQIMQLAESKGIDARRLCQAGNIPSVKEMPAAIFEDCKAWIAKQPTRETSPNAQASDILEDEVPY